MKVDSSKVLTRVCGGCNTGHSGPLCPDDPTVMQAARTVEELAAQLGLPVSLVLALGRLSRALGHPAVIEADAGATVDVALIDAAIREILTLRTSSARRGRF